MKAFWLLIVISLPLTVASSYCPDKCFCLWYTDHSLTVNCSRSEQSKIPYGIDPQVKILDLSYNEIISYNHSKYLKAIEEINLSNNKVSEAYFGGSYKYLKRIDLSYNSIADLRKIDIKKLPHLKKLNVSHNSKLQNLSGLKSDSLEYLDLNHCSVSDLSKDFLKNLPRIKFLDISYNSFEYLTNVRSKSLENLDASHGTLKNITPLEIYNLPELKKLNVSYNRNLKIDFFNENSCWDVEELDLSNSDLDSLDDMFPFCSLEILNASFNKIQIIEVRTFFNNCELSFANLTNNQISEIHERAFFATEKLKVLDLSANLIQNVDFSIYLKRVTDLDLSRNQISNLTGLLLKNVINLNLAHNKVKEISLNLNENASKIKKLNLSFNKIQNVIRMNSRSISRLDLSHCKIAFIDTKAFKGSENLIEVNLIGNKLTTLDFRIFNDLHNLKALKLMWNQWACNCQSQEFKELYKFLTQERFLTNVQELKCVKSNDTWKNTCTEPWHKEKEWKKTVYSLTVSLAIALIVVAVIFFCKYFNDKKQMEESRRAATERGEIDERRFSEFENSTTMPLTEEQEEIPHRCSTPPPNYEAALLLPILSEEQRNLVISMLSIASPATSNEQAEETEEIEIENENLTRSSN